MLFVLKNQKNYSIKLKNYSISAFLFKTVFVKKYLGLIKKLIKITFVLLTKTRNLCRVN